MNALFLNATLKRAMAHVLAHTATALAANPIPKPPNS